MRFSALDAFRGLAILGMCFSGRIPWDGLPAWMYHAQTPPPDHAVSKTTFGITWVDLVFPFFLFAMGAAIPIAMAKKGQFAQNWQMALGVLARGLLIIAFAIVVQHVRPDQLAQKPDASTHWLAIGLFLGVCLAFAKWPPKVPLWLGWTLRGIGWIALATALATLPFRDGKGFDIGRSDIILMILGNLFITGTLIWWLTRNSLLARVAVMAFLAALFLTRGESEFARAIWGWSPASWLYSFEFQKYLLILLPGTILGDVYLNIREGEHNGSWHWSRTFGIALAGIGASVATVFTLLGREHFQAMLVAILASVGMVAMAWKPRSSNERLIFSMTCWGAAFLPLGILLEPIGGGIRKDSPSTISYFFVTGGLAFLLMAALTVLYRSLPKWSPMRLFTDAGANPMLAYVAITNLSISVFVVTGIEGWVAIQGFSPWQLTVYAGLKTLFVGVLALLATRAKFFLRA